jgi:oligogalacturonide lyase
MAASPSEFSVRQDPETGRPVRQLTSFKGNSHHFYFTNPGWWDHDRRLLFGSDRMGRSNLFSLHLESGEITQHTDRDMPRPPRETSFIFAALNPQRTEVYFWRGPDLVAVELTTNVERLLWKCPTGYLPNLLSAAADGRHVFSVIYQDLTTKFPVDLLNGYVGINEYHDAHPHSQVIRVDVDIDSMDTVWQEHYWIGHVNASPTRPDLLSFCHEGPWDRVDNRIWMLDLTTGHARPIRERVLPGERVGHEYWHADGETIGYHGQRSEDEKFFGAIRHDNSNLREFPSEGETGHIHSLDSSLIVGDGGSHLRLWIKQGDRYGKSRLLCRHDCSSKVQQVHVHPRLSPDGRKIVFTSDRSGYGQVYEVELGDWHDLPTAVSE